jgi:type III secretion protein J
VTRFLVLLRSVLALGSCVMLFGCKEALFTQLTEREANEMLDALYAARITALKATADGKTWSIEVERESLPIAIRVLKDRGLPRESFTSTGDLFKKQGLVSSPAEERIRYIYAMSQELERTLTQIDGVIVARVHPVIPANDPLSGKLKPASASVFIKTRQNADIEFMTPAIRNLVMRSVEGLQPDNISITFTTSEAPVGRDTVVPLPPQFQFDKPTAVAAGLGAIVALLFSAAGHYLWRRRDAQRRNREATSAIPNRSQLFDSPAVVTLHPRRESRRNANSVESLHLASVDSLRNDVPMNNESIPKSPSNA